MISGNDGNDQIYGANYGDQLNGGNGNDYVEGRGGDDFLTGDAGNDTINGGAGNDNMSGGTGDDYFYVDSAGDTVVENANEGTDTVNTTLATYTLAANVENLVATSGTSLTGNALANSVSAGSGNSTINGLDGDDVISPGLGVDTVNGGNGFDTLVVDYSSLSLAVKMARPSGTGTNNGSIAASKADTVTFTSIENFTITTGSGNDSIATGDFNDTVVTGGGADTVNVGRGASDQVWLGDGNDSVTFLDFNLADYVDGGGGTDTLTISARAPVDLLNVTGIEVINLTSGTGYSLFSYDETVASGALLTINGASLKAAEALSFDGSHESDGRFAITSGAGADTLKGGAGADTISAGAGNDTIAGGGGDDILTGGNGADIFQIGAGNGHDRITDWTSSDKINFGSSTGVTSFSQLHFTQAGKDTVITWDGGGGNNITLAGVKATGLNASEFQFGASGFAVQQSSVAAASAPPTPAADHGNHPAPFDHFANDHLFG